MIVTLGRHEAMNRDLAELETTYHLCGVEVRRCESATTDSVFHRDTHAWTPFGHVAPTLMGKESRRWESRAWFETFDQYERFHTQSGLFEGADMLWLDSRQCVLGIGQRTNEVAASHLYSLFSFLTDTEVIRVNMPDWHDQHLLGILNCIRGEKPVIVVDSQALPAPTEEGWLSEAVIVPHAEAKSTNFVQVDDKIIIGRHCRATIQILEQYAQVIPVCIDQLLEYGGGVACATGFIQDQLPIAGPDWYGQEETTTTERATEGTSR